MAHNNKSDLNMEINMSNMSNKGNLDKSHDKNNDKLGLTDKLIYPLKASGDKDPGCVNI